MQRESWKRGWANSVTRRAWPATPYDADWDQWQELEDDRPSPRDIRGVLEEEMALGAVPHWAEEIVDRMVAVLPPCGHYTFPRPLLQICWAIRKEECPRFVCSCYTADSGRKVLMSYYVYCLDAWLKGAPLEQATAELAMRDDLGKDWPRIIADVYDSLGTRSEQKALLVTRLLHRLRWWIKTLIWYDDKRDRYLLDVYSGDVRGDEENWGAYGNSPFGDPYFAERELPEMKELAAKIRETVRRGGRLLERIDQTWLCAPKAFRYVERLILQIGSIGSERVTDADLSILQCEDTYPHLASCARWYSGFIASLSRWLEGDRQAMSELGEATPVKHWLARVLLCKLELLERHGNLGKLTGARRPGRSGSKRI